MKAVEELKAALAAATPGEWRFDEELGEILGPDNDDDQYFVCSLETDPDFALTEQDYKNAHLIALMHNTLPALIECAEALDAVMGVIKGSGADEEVLTSNFGKRYARKVLRARAALAKLETPPCATS